MENVPGMAASRVGGRRLTDLLLEDFDAMGYRVALLQLLATDYLVPQRRRRIFLVGSFDRAIGPPDAGTFALRILGRRPTAEDVSARAAIGDLGECGQRGARVAYADDPQSAFARLMRPKGTDDVTLHECPRMSIRDREFVRHIPPGGNYRDIPDRVATPRIMKFKETGGGVSDGWGEPLDRHRLLGSGHEFQMSSISAANRELHAKLVREVDAGVRRLEATWT